ncbi:MAG TPA: response regulator [Acidimicrobiia bacterium]
MSSPADRDAPAIRVLVVEDDSFSRTAVVDALAAEGFVTTSVGSVADALACLDDFDPHAICSDLHLGGGPSGIALLTHVAKERPWVGLVILTSHQSVESATGKSLQPPPGTVSLVKSSLTSLGEIGQAIHDAISAAERPSTQSESENEFAESVTVSAAQAEILALIAAGYTNAAIARERDTSLRSVEMLVTRTFRALGLDNDPDMNPRVLATRIWQSGNVVVR